MPHLSYYKSHGDIHQRSSKVSVSQVHDYKLSVSLREGFRIAVHHYLDYPHTEFSSINVGPGQHSKVAIKTTITQTSRAALSR